MSKKEKLIKKLKSKPKDMTYEELKTLLRLLSFYESNKGKTSGSRVMFMNEAKLEILIHKPHPTNIMKEYQIKNIVNKLEQEGII